MRRCCFSCSLGEKKQKRKEKGESSLIYRKDQLTGGDRAVLPSLILMVAQG